MIKRWAVFAGDNFYPCGGMSDYQASFSVRRDAYDYAKSLRRDWVIVYDMEDYE